MMQAREEKVHRPTGKLKIWSGGLSPDTYKSVIWGKALLLRLQRKTSK
jgi:hypothetical protein